MPKDDVLGLLLHILHTSGIPIIKSTVTATFSNDTVILTPDADFISHFGAPMFA